jgi:hypothetical protein
LTRRTRLLLVVLIVANLSLATYVLVLRFLPSGDPVTQAIQKRKLPALLLRDDKGQEIDTRNFSGRPLFIQFIKSEVEQQTDLASEVLRNLPEQSITCLFITADARLLRQALPSLNPETLVVEQDYAALRKIFDIPECCEMTLIYDKEGSLKDKRYYYQGGVVAELQTISDGSAPFSTDLFGSSINTVSTGKFADIRNRSLKTPSGIGVVTFFSNVCTLCSSGDIVDALNDKASLKNDYEFLIFLPRNFTRADVNNFESNLSLKVPVAVADDELAAVWEPLVSKYGEARTKWNHTNHKQGKSLGHQEIRRT